jgi:molybdate transport system substrate-binding protein
MTLGVQMRRILLVLAIVLFAPLAHAVDLVVFAAASMTDALKDVEPLWEKQGGSPIKFSFAASGTLARQMEQGAPANLFISADEQWMNYADQHKLIVASTRRDLLGNTLVLVMPKDSVKPVEISAELDIDKLLGADGRIATGDPASVPAGIYAKQAFTKLGLWDKAQPRIAGADSVRSALLLVSRHEAPVGVVYATDAAVDPGVAVAGTFPEDSHPPIIYPFAVTTAGDTPEARKLLDFLASPPASAIFAKRGFAVLTK